MDSSRSAEAGAPPAPADALGLLTEPTPPEEETGMLARAAEAAEAVEGEEGRGEPPEEEGETEEEEEGETGGMTAVGLDPALIL